jgi:hypothetical protein
MLQGILPTGFDVTKPIQGPDGAEWRAWSATLPAIGRTSHATDHWRELDTLQALFGHGEESTGDEGN